MVAALTEKRVFSFTFPFSRVWFRCVHARINLYHYTTDPSARYREERELVEERLFNARRARERAIPWECAHVVIAVHLASFRRRRAQCDMTSPDIEWSTFRIAKLPACVPWSIFIAPRRRPRRLDSFPEEIDWIARVASLANGQLLIGLEKDAHSLPPLFPPPGKNRLFLPLLFSPRLSIDLRRFNNRHEGGTTLGGAPRRRRRHRRRRCSRR